MTDTHKSLVDEIREFSSETVLILQNVALTPKSLFEVEIFIDKLDVHISGLSNDSTNVLPPASSAGNQPASHAGISDATMRTHSRFTGELVIRGRSLKNTRCVEAPDY